MQKQFDWKPFQQKGGRFRNYNISIICSKKNENLAGFGFLSGFYHKEQIEDYNYVLLFYSNEVKPTIGFHFLNDKTVPGAFKLTKGAGSASVFPGSFWAAHSNISPKEHVGRYIPKEDKSKRFGKIFYIELVKMDEE